MAKSFGADKVEHYGSVVGWSAPEEDEDVGAEAHWTVRYDDGDEEDNTLTELAEIALRPAAAAADASAAAVEAAAEAGSS